MASMRNWLRDPDAAKDGRVVVVHCKAGKGRSGTVACSYLISEEGWKAEDALGRFTQRRMRVGFGAGVSIPSQLRWVGYVDRWTKHGKMYVERQVEILEVHTWGLRDGVKVSIQGFIDEGRTIKTFHVFDRQERMVVDSMTHVNGHFAEPIDPINEKKNLPTPETNNITQSPPSHLESEIGGPAVIFRPSTRIVLPSNDINIDFERRNRATYGWAMVTAVAHVWFNAYFEGLGPEKSGASSPSGVFEIQWDAMDGIKGSSRKGTRALDRLAVVWRVLDAEEGEARVVPEPKAGEPVPEMEPADWKGANKANEGLGKELGIRAESPGSAAMSKASSMEDMHLKQTVDEEEDELVGVQTHGLDGAPNVVTSDGELNFDGSPRLLKDHIIEKEVGLGTVAGIVSGMKHIRTNDLPGGRPKEEMETSEQSSLGKISREKKP